MVMDMCLDNTIMLLDAYSSLICSERAVTFQRLEGEEEGEVIEAEVVEEEEEEPAEGGEELTQQQKPSKETEEDKQGFVFLK